MDMVLGLRCGVVGVSPLRNGLGALPKCEVYSMVPGPAIISRRGCSIKSAPRDPLLSQRKSSCSR